MREESSQPLQKRGKRAIRADETRRALLAAAATVVGKRGYEDASVAEITKLAGVANGTFYNYFPNRQNLFDQLLPAVGERLLEHIRSQRQDDVVGSEREEQRIVAYFEFFERNPGFLRILNEAEVFAPKAFKQHVRNFAERYVNALKRQLNNEELGPYDEAELEAIVYILMGARSYLTMLSRAKSSVARKNLDKSLIATYLKLLRSGLFPGGKESSRRSAPSEAQRLRQLKATRQPA